MSHYEGWRSHFARRLQDSNFSDRSGCIGIDVILAIEINNGMAKSSSWELTVKHESSPFQLTGK